jgi:hypothetical protein
MNMIHSCSSLILWFISGLFWLWWLVLCVRRIGISCNFFECDQSKIFVKTPTHLSHIVLVYLFVFIYIIKCWEPWRCMYYTWKKFKLLFYIVFNLVEFCMLERYIKIICKVNPLCGFAFESPFSLSDPLLSYWGLTFQIVY